MRVPQTDNNARRLMAVFQDADSLKADMSILHDCMKSGAECSAILDRCERQIKAIATMFGSLLLEE